MIPATANPFPGEAMENPLPHREVDATAGLPGGCKQVGPADNVDASATKEVIDTAGSFTTSVCPSMHPSNKASIQPFIHPSITPTAQSSSHPSIQPAPIAEPQSSIHSPRQVLQPSREGITDWRPLTEAQGKVLLSLLHKFAGATNVNMVSQATGVPIGTAKDCLRALIRYGYITHKSRVVSPAFHGFQYALNHPLCVEYVAKIQGTDPEQRFHPSIKPSTNHPPPPSIHPAIQTSESLSSSRNNSSTTTFGQLIDLREPELQYWVDQGLTLKRINNWLAETGMSAVLLEQSLRYARFDILNRGDVKKPMDWFYAEIKRNGSYRKPLAYKSFQDIRIEEEKVAIEIIERQIAELEELRRKKEEAEFELNFQNVVTKKDDIYHLLLAELSPFQKEFTGKMLETALREIYLEKFCTYSSGSSIETGLT